MQACQQLVQFSKACRYAHQLAAVLFQRFHVGIAARDNRADMLQLVAAGALHDDIKDGLLRVAENVVKLHLLAVAIAADGAGGADQPAKCGFFQDDVDVVADVDGGRNGLDQVDQVTGAADTGQHACSAQLIVHRDQVDRARLLVQVAHGLEDGGVLGLIKIILRHHFHRRHQGVVILHQRA